MRWQVKHRMAFIARKLLATGKINRADIMQEFGISTPQASIDLREFQKIAPLKYDNRKKFYYTDNKERLEDAVHKIL